MVFSLSVQVPDGDAWEALRSVQGIIQATCTSLDLIMQEGGRQGDGEQGIQMREVVEYFKQVQALFSEKFRNFHAYSANDHGV